MYSHLKHKYNMDHELVQRDIGHNETYPVCF